MRSGAVLATGVGGLPTIRRTRALTWLLWLVAAVTLAGLAATVQLAGAGAAAAAPSVPAGTGSQPSPNAATVGDRPGDIAIAPDGTFALVVTGQGTGTLARIRTSDNTVTGSLSIPDASGVAISPDGSFALVTLGNAGQVRRVRLSDFTVVATVTVGAMPSAVDISPDGSFAYVANIYGSSVSRIRTSDNTVVATIGMTKQAGSVKISPDGSFAYVTVPLAGTVQRYRTSDNALISTTSVGSLPLGLAISPDGSFAYVGDITSSRIYRLRTSDNALVATLSTPSACTGLDIAPNGAFAYVACSSSNRVLRIATSDNTVTATASVPGAPIRVAIAPSSAFAYVSQTDLQTVARLEVPRAISGVVATPGLGQLSVAFDLPANDLDTNLEYSLNGGTTWVPRSPTGSTSPLVIAGLTNGTSYQVKLRAVNVLGTGPATATVTQAAGLAPSAPTLVSAVPRNGGLTATFEAPADLGTPTATDYQYSLDGGSTWTTRSAASMPSPLLLDGLSNGTHVSFVLRMTNVVGPGQGTAVAKLTVGTIPVGMHPNAVAFAPDGTYAYTTNMPDGTISRVRTSDDTTVATIPVGTAPADVAISPNGQVAYVANRDSNTVSVIQPSSGTVIATVPVGSGPVAVDFSPDSTFAYVVNRGSGTVSRIDTTTHTVTATFAVGTYPQDVVFKPTGNLAYVANGWNQTVVEVNTATNALVRTFTVGTPPAVGDPYGGGPNHLAINGNYLYVTNNGFNSLTRVDLTSTAQTRRYLATVPGSLAVNPAGTQVLVSSGPSNVVWRVQTSDVTITSTDSVGFTPIGIAFAADGSYAFVANSGEASLSRLGTASAPTALVATPGNASASVSFALPTTDGGTPITNYKYAVSTNGGSTWGPWTALSPGDTTSPVAIPGLVNGTSYVVRLLAVNGSGDGTASAASAAFTPRTVAGAPTALSATPGNASATVTFTAPASDGGAAISNYKYAVSTNGGTTWGAWTALAPADASSPVTITGLTNGTSTLVKLLAVNAAGDGAASAASPAFTPRTVPSAPTGLVATPGNASASVAFTPPASDGGAAISNYKYSLSTNAGGSWGAWTALSPADAATPVTIPGLVNGTSYLIKLLAVNVAGDGAQSAASGAFTPRTLPGAPTITAVTGGVRQVSVGFTPGSDGGSPLTNYEYSVNDGTTWTAMSPPVTSGASLIITGLGNGQTVQVRIRALNAAGTGPASNSYSSMTFPALGAPSGLVATAGNASASVAFTAPGVNPAPITNYKFALSSNGGGTWGAWTALSPAATASPVTIPGLTNGTTYLVKLLGVNAVGDGAESLPSAPFTPRTVPGAPTGLAVTPANAAASVAFTAPADGGAAITNYSYALSTNGGSSWGGWTALSPSDASPPVTIPGLVNGTAYVVKLRAVNAVGDGAESAASAPFTPRTVAGPPTGLLVTPGDASASVGFAAPASDGGAAITNYSYALSTDAGSSWSQWTALAPPDASAPVTIPGLVNWTSYLVKLRALNAAGPGAESSPASVVPTPVGMLFQPVSPARVVDSRTGSGGPGPVQPGEAGMRVVSVAATQDGGVPVVPAGATAVVVNVTTPSPANPGHVRLMPGDAATLTSASALNYRAGETIANGITARISASRELKVYTSSATDVILDVVGYFVPVPPPAGAPTPQNAVDGGRFTSVDPVRVYDTSKALEGALAPGETRTISTATTQDGKTAVVPAGATAVAYNLTVVRPDGPGHLRVMPGDVASSPASAINWARTGDVIANGLTVAVDAQQRIRVYNAAAVPVPILVDVAGYYSASGALFYPTDPTRVLDTRTSSGGIGAIAGGEAGIRTASVASALPSAGGSQQVPAGATAIAYNLTVTATTSGGHLRVFPAGAPLVSASTINWPDAGYSRANATVGRISADRQVAIYNGSATPADALIDTLGYYR